MREIKFRAWDKKNAKMIPAIHIFINGAGVMWENKRDGLEGVDNLVSTVDFERMEFTGLTDKNNVDIYVGDILKITEEDEDSCMGREFEYICEVCFGGGEYPASYTVKSEKFYKKYAILGYNRWELEVIGNIYEPPTTTM